MTKNVLLGVLAPLAIFSGVVNVHAKEIVPDQLEQCGAFVRIAPFCGEALEADTRQLQAMQIIPVSLSPLVSAEWEKVNREKRRGISFVATNDKGQKVQTGRPVIAAVSRVIAIPPSGNTEDTMLFQALVTPDMTSMMVLLPAEGNFTGWSFYILSSEGKHALTLRGELVKLGGRHRDDGNIQPDLAHLPTSQVTSTTLITRGDGTGTIEALESTFTDHKLVYDRDGSIRVYSGLRGTFTPLSEDTMSVAMAFSNCRTAGQRLVEKGNLRIDSATLAAAGPTMGLSVAPQLIQNLRALLGASCRK